MKNKAIIIIGGSRMQLNSIKQAKELNLYVVVTDKNPYAPAKDLADRFEVISATDIKRIFELAKSIEEKFELIGIYSSNDFAVKTTANISKQMNLKGYHDISFIEKSLNKYLTKEIWDKNGVPVPNGYKVSNENDLIKAMQNLELPVIIKSLDSCGSQGVTSVWHEKDLIDAFYEAKKYSEEVIIEEFIEGINIDVNGLFVEGEFFPCGITERFFELPDHYQTFGYIYMQEKYYKLIYETLEKAARSLGVKSGPVKADMILKNGKVKVLELGPRFHGDLLSAYLLPLSGGINPMKAYFSYLIGDETYKNYLRKETEINAGWCAILSEENGIISSIDGVDKARNIDGVCDIIIRKSQGDAVSKPKDNSSTVGFIIAKANSKDEIQNILNSARACIKIVLQ